MAMGKTAHTGCSEVVSHVNALEISPSQHSPTSPIARGGSEATGHGVSAHTGRFASHGKTTRPKPRGTKTGFGKKNMTTQKSHGR
jgi:hypothetical protein